MTIDIFADLTWRGLIQPQKQRVADHGTAQGQEG